jgi:hypothetical protein
LRLGPLAWLSLGPLLAVRLWQSRLCQAAGLPAKSEVEYQRA